MKIAGARTAHVPGWTGPLIEDAEPDAVDGKGALDDGANLVAQSAGRRVTRGGSRVAVTYAAVSSSAISDVLGVYPYTACGAVVAAHSTTGVRHYAYAHTDTLGWALTTEAASRTDLLWNSATAARPLGVELFEKLYIVDATESAARQGMAVAVFAGGAFTITVPTYDLDASGGSPGVLRGYAAEVFGGVLFVSGYDSESAPSSGNAPHLIRHSLLGTDPAASGGFDPNAYLILGSKGQYVRAMKAGRTVMMAAKDNELFLISGSGRALPGWQYQVQPVGNTIGAGCTNPYALDHAFGMWYGLGRTGPWRSDGSSVELLRAGRDRSWSRADRLQTAQVRLHPDRRQVLFNLYELGRPSYAVAPFQQWVWDLDRERWDLSQRYARSFHWLGTVTQGSTVAPSGIPGAPSQDMVYAFAYDAIEGTLVPADATASTEVWTRTASGTSALWETLGVGRTRFRLTGLAASDTRYVKVRHSKSGAVSDFSSETLCYTRLRAPFLVAGSESTTDTETQRAITTAPFHGGAALAVTTTGASYSASWAAEPASIRTDYDTTPATVLELYSGITTEILWPSGHQASASGQMYQVAGGSATPATPVQSLSIVPLVEDTITFYY